MRCARSSCHTFSVIIIIYVIMMLRCCVCMCLYVCLRVCEREKQSAHSTPHREEQSISGRCGVRCEENKSSSSFHSDSHSSLWSWGLTTHHSQSACIAAWHTIHTPVSFHQKCFMRYTFHTVLKKYVDKSDSGTVSDLKKKKKERQKPKVIPLSWSRVAKKWGVKWRVAQNGFIWEPRRWPFHRHVISGCFTDQADFPR